MKHALLTAAVLGFLAAPAPAQQSLTLDIRDGVVNLDATSVPVGQILAEWARVGGTKVVGADKITGGPVTLKLVNTPERQALDILLRNVSGYMAAPRLASATPGASTYDRILILPTAAPVVNNNPPPARTATTTPFGNPNRLPRPPGMAEADSDPQQQEVADQTDMNAGNQPPVFTFPQPQQMPGAGMPGNNVFAPVAPNQNVFNPAAFGAPGTTPPVTFQPNPNGQPMIYNFVPNTTGAQPPANGGFTVIGSPTPGMVQQPAPAPGQPVPPRPPGSN